MQSVSDLPGGDEFEDVTDVFTEAAKDMDSEDLIFTDGFTLMDAMSAFEIGEPRMDSGMVLEDQRTPRFDPLAPLLPQEVCWIIDRMFACEMEWHSGNSLSQTVYTSLYVHHLEDINPEYLARDIGAVRDPARPRELISVVLRAATFGLLKSCDLSWRELSKGKVHDIEDWLAEKCEVSLLEGISVDFVITKLDDACRWLNTSTLAAADAAFIYERLKLRKAILQLLKPNFPLKPSDLRALSAQAQTILRRIREQPIPAPSPASPALAAFDAHITRRLPNFMPTRVTAIPPQPETWRALEQLLGGWEELGRLLEAPTVATWEIAGSLRLWVPGRQAHAACVRSLVQSAFYDRNLVVGQHPPMWLLDRFFLETLDVSWEDLLERIRPEGGASAPLVREIERRIIRLMIPHIRSYWYNPPRRRRYLAKSVIQWQEVYDRFYQLTAHCHPNNATDALLLENATKVVWARRLAVTREVVLAGLQQDLYAPQERPVAYWYLACVSRKLHEVMINVSESVQSDAVPYSELLFQSGLGLALQYMGVAMCVLTNEPPAFPLRRMELNHLKRYKWAFLPEYDDLCPALPVPELSFWQEDIVDISGNAELAPQNAIKRAIKALMSLIISRVGREYAADWDDDRQTFLHQLLEVCKNLEQKLPAIHSAAAGRSANLAFKWEGRSHPWFPDITI
ncbi:Mak10-domain-containing protein [Wolfiporia cocos MD-104 SS10]|uniref:Mak10-domain-containing protein n=1 Tax=Wolfiporia cocos (strain MD-104) TaxID=742152 RepID=A0A2H3JIF2_WOLCO|nr:Mak10-domain-containing protein [Wolfiporia cocos MD-104 SS10]